MISVYLTHAIHTYREYFKLTERLLIFKHLKCFLEFSFFFGKWEIHVKILFAELGDT